MTLAAQCLPEPYKETSFPAPPREVRSYGRCRLCSAPLATSCVDLGMSPLCESFLTAEQTNQMEPYFPLHALVCRACFLVQLQEYVKPEEIFTEYAYFSSYSTSWVAHARRYCEMIASVWALARAAASSKSRATTDIFFNISCRWEFPFLASSRQRMSQKLPWQITCRHWSSSLALNSLTAWSPKAAEQI